VTTAVVIVAAGSGTRLGHRTPKAFTAVAGSSMLERCVDVLNHWSADCSVVVVVPKGWEQPAQELLAHSTKPLTVVAGGAERTDSVRAGLAAVDSRAKYVLIHDAARALMPMDVFDRVLETLRSGHVGVIPQLPVVDTLVTIEAVPAPSATALTEVMLTGQAVDRSVLGAVQTPQGFDAQHLLAAYASVSGDFTDDAAVMREAGHQVVAVVGDPQGFKITYPEDLRRAEMLVTGGASHRVGTALDVHQFDAAGVLRLAGLDWPGEKGLTGHSDGDVVIHAIVDALLQAAGLGDLGTHFGSDRPEFEGANSQVFLDHALTLVREAGFRVDSVGVQVIANSPKIGPRRAEAQQHLTRLVGAPVALSATTTDGLGLTGRGEGAAALATAVLSAL
jgi:2-C-methyl-D-erythritol 4-phosphate cytidylyltransferase/2-C-methyl-D-erythritol 2,4-cyclodiphosphate synthase